MYLYYYIDATEQCDADADLHLASGSSLPVLHILLLSQPQRASIVRVKRPPPVLNERRTRRRISDEEMGLGDASASCGQDKHGAEDVEQVPAGCGQDKQDVEDVRQFTAGCGQDKHNPGGARPAPSGCRQSIVGPEPPQAF